MADDHVTGEVAELFRIVKQEVQNARKFKSRFKSIDSTLKFLEAPIASLNSSDDQLFLVEELYHLHDMLLECAVLTQKCSKVVKWKFWLKYCYSEKLLALDNGILRFCQIILPVDMALLNNSFVRLSVMQERETREDHQDRTIQFQSCPTCSFPQCLDFLVGTDFEISVISKELVNVSEPVIGIYAAAGEYGNTILVKKLDRDEQFTGGYENTILVKKLYRDEQFTASYEYDVFLSFRGEDTRESFTSTLFYFLSKVYKVKIFMDTIFEKGSKLEELLQMIEKSRMSIVVFSENFAESEWCLKELTKIFEESDRRGHKVVPVFYKVNPSELRHQDSGKTKVHMDKHHNTYGKESDTVKSWSNAIKELGNSSGYTYWSGRGKQEVELVEEISQEILNGLHGWKVGEQGFCDDKSSSSIGCVPTLPQLGDLSSTEREERQVQYL